LIVESLLGVQRRGEQLWLTPCIPAHWHEYKVKYRNGDALYRINITQSDSHRGAPSIVMDGVVMQTPWINLRSADGDHQVEVVIARAKAIND
jgi:cyclic beta-1,2-glucan synthetase